MTKVSIITSTYNGAKFIQETIDSVLWQSYTEFEYLIINDASTDNTIEILQKYKEKDSRIKIFHNEKNLERSVSRNIWIKEAQWEYIAFVDDDDVWEKEKLEIQLQFLDSNSDYIYCWSYANIIDSTWAKTWEIVAIADDTTIKNKFLVYNPFIFSSIIVRHWATLKYWWFKESISMAEDYELLLRYWKWGKVKNIEKKLVRYRLHWNSSLKNQFTLRWNCIKNCIQYRKDYPNFYQALLLWVSLFILPYSLVKFLNKLFPEKIKRFFF